MSTAGSPNPESLPSRAWSSAPLCPAGIGVPIMLAYVYGVVPISLCRGGGCGVSTANGKGSSFAQLLRCESDAVRLSAACGGQWQCPGAGCCCGAPCWLC